MRVRRDFSPQRPLASPSLPSRRVACAETCTLELKRVDQQNPQGSDYVLSGRQRADHLRANRKRRRADGKSRNRWPPSSGS